MVNFVVSKIKVLHIFCYTSRCYMFMIGLEEKNNVGYGMFLSVLEYFPLKWHPFSIMLVSFSPVTYPTPGEWSEVLFRVWNKNWGMQNSESFLFPPLRSLTENIYSGLLEICTITRERSPVLVQHCFSLNASMPHWDFTLGNWIISKYRPCSTISTLPM